MENKFNFPDLKQEALDYFDSITENVFSLPEFPPPKKDILSAFTFKNFCHHFQQHKHKKTKHIPKILLVVAKLFAKNHKHWFKSDLRHLFRWHDVHVSHIIHKNTKDHCHAIAQFMHDLCSFTYKNTSGVSEDRTLESFLSHPIYDYSRPYDWHLRQDYVSYSQVLMAIYCEKVGKGFPSTLENKFVSQSNASIKSRFHKLFPEEFPEHLDQKTIKIPYSLYEKCWHSAQSDATIQPYDIEICFYFTQQNNLGLNYVVDDFWDGKIGGNKHEHKIVLHVIPLMKFFSLYDWRRLQIMNAIISSQEDSDLIQRWKHTAAKTYIYHQLPDIHGLGGLAVCRANIFLSHQGALNNFYRIDKGHSLIYPLVQTSLLNQHITQSFLEWLCQQSDQSYDLRYLNIITPALETLKRNGQFLVDSREKIQKHPKSSHLMKVLFKEFPLVGILSVLLKNDPSHAHKIPDLTSVLDKQKSKDHHLHLKIHSLTPQQKSALSVKKYIPTSIDPIITDLIKSVRKDKDLHDYIAPHDLFYRNHRVEIKLKPLSAHLLPKQGLSSLQKSQDPKMSLRAIHDLNALSLVKSSVFSLHSTTAARVIAHLPAEDLQVNKDPTLDLWKITDSVGSIQAELNQNQIAAARGLVQNAVGGDVPLPKTNPIELPPPQGSTLVRMMDDWKTNYPEEYAEFQNRPKPAGRPAGVGAKGAPSAGLFDEDASNDFSGDGDDILSLPEVGDEAEPLSLPEAEPLSFPETETFVA